MAPKSSKIRDWAKYNAASKKSGEITFYISQEAIASWVNKSKTGKRGASQQYSDIAIETCLIIRSVYKLSLRKANGFIESLFKIMNLNLRCPDYTTMSRRAEALTITIDSLQTKGPIVVAIDSTGIKVYGEGEWKVRQHGISKRRTWLKLHVAVNVHTLQIESFELTKNDVHDSEIAPSLIKQIKKPIRAMDGDGAYDAVQVYQAAHDVKAQPNIPPCRGAKKQNPQNAIPDKLPRDVAIEYIEKRGGDEAARKSWKEASGYHARSLAETTMYRYKTHFSPSAQSRKFANQRTEVALKVKILNSIAALGTFPLNRAASLQ